MFKKDFLRIKFDDKNDDSISHTLKVYNLINKILEKKDHIYKYDYKVWDSEGNTAVDIYIKPKN